jgi:ABC-type bacteriocin/lantibiotic exporter with double-glycine peptidase domain
MVFIRKSEKGAKDFLKVRTKDRSCKGLYQKIPLLILDEATSALDEATEYRILDYIKSMAYHPTCIIITHRKAAISICNRHIHIENEKLSELI